jgi:hypothetical protein
VAAALATDFATMALQEETRLALVDHVSLPQWRVADHQPIAWTRALRVRVAMPRSDQGFSHLLGECGFLWKMKIHRSAVVASNRLTTLSNEDLSP